MLLSSHPKITHPKLTTRVTPTHRRKRETAVAVTAALEARKWGSRWLAG